MGKYGVGVTPLVGENTGDGVITKNVGELFTDAAVPVGEINGFRVGVAVPGRNVGTGESAGVKVFAKPG